jgi:hypothetical protein
MTNDKQKVDLSTKIRNEATGVLKTGITALDYYAIEYLDPGKDIKFNCVPLDYAVMNLSIYSSKATAEQREELKERIEKRRYTRGDVDIYSYNQAIDDILSLLTEEKVYK